MNTNNSSPVALFAVGCICGVCVSTAVYFGKHRKSLQSITELKQLFESSKLSNVALNESLSLKVKDMNDLLISNALLQEKYKMMEASELDLRRVVQTIPKQISDINNSMFVELKAYKDILSSEAVKLTNSLRSPNARGMWG